MKKIVTEIISYVNKDLLARNAQRWVPRLVKRRLFKKPHGWHRVFPHAETPAAHDHSVWNLRESIQAAQKWLLNRQHAQGYWCAELRADTTLEADSIMLFFFLGWQDRPEIQQKIQRLAAFILRGQNAEGGWPVYRNGPSELSATVKSYWALKFAGHTPDEEPLKKARGCIFRLGGIHKINSYSKFYMAIFGLYDWGGVPAIPPEIMLFPSWFYFNICEMSSWTRGIVIPLSIVWAKRPLVPVPDHARLDELFPPGTPPWVPVGADASATGRSDARLAVWRAPEGEGLFSWRKFFLEVDTFLKTFEGKGPYFLRTWALRRAERWVAQHSAAGGVGAIFPALMNSMMAFRVLGYPDDHPAVQANGRELEAFELDRGDHGLEMQPCFSPVWDTAISLLALAESGWNVSHPALVRAAEWLLKKEVRILGDWRVKNTAGPVGGWFFEFENALYPDVDDTSMVLLALRRVHLEDPVLRAEREKAFLRGLNWMLSMQSANGGWAAFDVDNIKYIFTKIPFADHNAMIDPPTADITGRVLELLGQVGYDKSYPQVQRAIQFLKREQEPDGSWYGRWGVNYLYGTWQVVRGLTSVGEYPHAPYLQAALGWLRSVQRPDGGWGERCDTYEDPSRKGQGPSTPSQTAWALMAFLTCGLLDDPAVERGMRYLLSTQRPDGTWDEEEFTGTGFPKVFYLDYTYYRHYFPLLALGMYSHLHRRERSRRPVLLQAV